LLDACGVHRTPARNEERVGGRAYLYEDKRTAGEMQQEILPILALNSLSLSTPRPSLFLLGPAKIFRPISRYSTV